MMTIKQKDFNVPIVIEKRMVIYLKKNNYQGN